MLEHPDTGSDGERGVVTLISSAAAVSDSVYFQDQYLTKPFSINQFEGQPGRTAYVATKGVLRSMTLPLSRDLARHAIRVVTIAPGIFDSSMTANFPVKTRKSLENESIFDPKRFGQPEEFARTVRWILDCPYVNGETIRLSGAGRLPGKL
jgi:3-hydroxyacyl-CoA dehydrogenase / 3-hydroxy-2-methylbutyryl-CoA dehydrogenase